MWTWSRAYWLDWTDPEEYVTNRMFQVKEIVNSIFNSKTYILFRGGDDKGWLVDIGDIDPVDAFCEEKGLKIEGVFLTHGHFDHIYGLVSLLGKYPECEIYTTEYGKKSLASDRLNLSRYHETPISYDGNHVVVVHEGESLTLFAGEPQLVFHETPGHNPGCLTLTVGDLIFTGDAFIPGVAVNTQLPHADKVQAQQSVEKIMKLAEGKRILSGHQV